MDETQAAPVVKKTGPKWEADVLDRLKGAVKRFQKPLSELVARDANEGDTRLLITDFLCDALGFDKYADLTTEYQVKGEFADYGLRIDKDLVAFLEVKRVTTKLAPKHLRQVEMYAVNEGVEWVILTNGSNWQCYHLDVTQGLPVLIDLVLDLDLLEEGRTATQKAKTLFYLSQESLKRRQIAELWQLTKASSPKSLAQVLLTPNVLEAIRKELRRRTGHKLEPSELASVLKEGVIRSECLS